jgi:hypothetical protein
VSAVIYYIFTARNAERSRKAQLFMSLYEQFNNYEWMQRWTEKFYIWEWKDFDDYFEKYGPIKNPNAFSSYNSTCAFFEGIGVLLKNKLIDIEIVTQLIYSPVVWMWEKTESITKGYRERYNAPQLWEYYEYLVNEMRKEKQPPPNK